MRRRGEAWFEGQLDLDPDRLVFIDGEPSRRHRSETEGERNQHKDGTAAQSGSGR